MEHQASLPSLKLPVNCPYSEPVDINLIKFFNKWSFNGAN